MKSHTVVAVSGGFDPLHVGHVRMFEEARALGDELVVILNNDNWLTDKKGRPFMSEEERKEIIESIRWVDTVVITDHAPGDGKKGARAKSVERELARIRPNIFANGGDRDEANAANPESSLYWDIKACDEHNIQIVYNIGHGGKVQSSSWLIDAAAKHKEGEQK